MEYRFLLSYILVLVAIYYTYRENLGLHRRIAFNTVRAFFQLLLLGYILLYIFKIENVFGLLLILLFMCIFAAWTAQRRIVLFPKGYLTAFLSMFLSSAIVLASMVTVKVVSLSANELIPLGGMIIGNSLNIYTLVVDRLKSEVKNTLELIESRVALGATLREALQPAAKAAIKAAFIPILNTLQTVGIIHIPGITTGMLIAGVEPLKAVSYQIAILYMLVAVALFTGYFTILITVTKIIPAIYKPESAD
jgi:putative ABC transport system permease protein